MNDLERSALLGNRKAQEECTRKGILLSCPMCGCGAEVKSPAPYIYYVMCVWCGLKAPETGLKITALEKWNRRSAPPVGRCKDCANACPGTYCLVCVIHGCNTDDDAWCNEFDPKEG